MTCSRLSSNEVGRPDNRASTLSAGSPAGALMGVGRIGRMPFAVDDDDGDLALALAERIAGAEIGAQRPHHLHQLGIVDIDLVRAGKAPPRLDQRAVALLLFRRHPVIGDLGIAAKSRRLGHWAISSFWVGYRPILPPRGGHVDRIAGFRPRRRGHSRWFAR